MPSRAQPRGSAGARTKASGFPAVFEPVTACSTLSMPQGWVRVHPERMRPPRWERRRRGARALLIL